ncbi:hypothetical protein L3V79_05060 [Thiotrichales bacterium 19S9-12]|nr:hypothetical protein [Thiotrichales bacterium 19S9-11]MCF6811727.1 hypothetical protein [Thiotrichales bacterium 19S9-12]
MMDYYFLYLHGYQSTPTTLKGLKLQTWLRENYPESRIDAPLLPDHDALGTFQKVSETLDLVQSNRKVIIGTSLGGLMAHLLKQNRADITDVILINPAISFEDVIKDLGFIEGDADNSAISQTDVDVIRSIMPEKIKQQEDYLLLLQEDDDICLFQHALDAFPHAQVDLQVGQGHQYQNIEVAFDVMRKFLSRS